MMRYALNFIADEGESSFRINNDKITKSVGISLFYTAMETFFLKDYI